MGSSSDGRVANSGNFGLGTRVLAGPHSRGPHIEGGDWFFGVEFANVTCGGWVLSPSWAGWPVSALACQKDVGQACIGVVSVAGAPIATSGTFWFSEVLFWPEAVVVLCFFVSCTVVCGIS